MASPNGEHVAQNMDEEKAARDGQAVANQHVKVAEPEPMAANIAQPVNAPPQEQAAKEYHTEAERELSQFESATIRLAKLAFCASILAAIFVGLQWYEMHSGSADTKAIAEATGKQADAAKKQVERMKDFADRMKDQADQTKTIADQAVISADSAKSAANTAEKAMTVGNRPWVKISHRIVQPLTFGFNGAAIMQVEDTIENVGTTIALNVLSWEDVIPEDYEVPPGKDFALPTTRRATARQKEWCDANRNSEQSRTIGNILFPHSPVIQISSIGPLMSKVNDSLSHSPIKGKVSFVMVGCVVYRSSFEDPGRPNHQTRFMYRLGIPQSSGGWYPFVRPEGAAADLRLIASFDGLTAN